jgi:LPS export ABC transporter protein LptC
MRRGVLLLTLLVLAACSGEDSGPLPQAVDRPSRVVDGFEVTETRGGRIEWRLVSDRAEYFGEESLTRLEGVTLRFFREDGSPRAVLTSLRGKVEDVTGNLLAEGDVVIITVEGDTLTTDELLYDNPGDEIRGEGPVRISKPDRILTGIGFRSKPDLSSYVIEEDVQVTLHDDLESLDDEQ